MNGQLSQHVEYIPFGEVLFEEHSSSISMPYLFNGKELDRETNLTYYGARYLDMKTSLWLNIDPLAEKFPNTSSYVYCLNNPIKLIDPDGKAPNPPKWLKNFWREVKQTLKDDFSNYKVNKFNKDVIEPIKSLAEKIDNLILSITQEKNDKLQGNSKGHFKRGINFINKDNNDPTVKRGLETANYGEKVENMDTSIFGLSTNGLQSIGDGLLGHPNRIIDAIDNIGSSVDAGYSTKEAYNNLKEASKINAPQKNDTLESLYYGGKEGKLLKIEKSVNGKVVKVEKRIKMKKIVIFFHFILLVGVLSSCKSENKGGILKTYYPKEMCTVFYEYIIKNNDTVLDGKFIVLKNNGKK
ncbi:RHS repeat-associated core domain-containing protein [Flavobacterium covae]|nr:RHS repeat-associated core domain-containing protein [Flavobacterium covae]QYS92430.1 RHS repeat-associated core domain-containing protein [Flavobacterium covae]